MGTNEAPILASKTGKDSERKKHNRCKDNYFHNVEYSEPWKIQDEINCVKYLDSNDISNSNLKNSVSLDCGVHFSINCGIKVLKVHIF